MALATGAAFLVAGPVVEACGDKLLSISRGIRLQQAYKARHPASILLYVGDPSDARTGRERDALVQLSLLYMSLRQAGHGIEVVESPDELDQALRSRDFHYVLADPRDVDAVSERLAAGAAGPSVQPVLFKPSKSDMASARKRFDLVLKTPATSTAHLEAIDRAMDSRSGRAQGR
jgi:hypothetical protein